MEKNRYEEVPQKENVFKKIFKGIGLGIAHFFYDFFVSFKYNNMKLAAIFIAVPGVFIGFFMGIHASVLQRLSYTIFKSDLEQPVLYKVPFNFSGMSLFLLMLFGILNIFTAVTCSGKKNLGSVVLATITTVLLTAAGALYLYSIYVYYDGVAKRKEWEKTLSEAERIDILANRSECAANANVIGIGQGDTKISQSNLIMSIGSVIISIVFPLVGCILGFINYDRTYEKVTR